MSIEHMSTVWKHFTGNPTAKLVLLSLADQANSDGYCWPSQRYTAGRCMISDRQLRTWLQRLVAEGWLEVVKRDGKSDVYRVLTPEAHFQGTPEADFQGGRKPTSAHPGSPLPTNHKEPSSNPKEEPTPVPRCPYCKTALNQDKPGHYCSAMNMRI